MDRIDTPSGHQPGPPALDLVAAATRAASSHNTQPWKFRISGRRITILPDFERRCSRVDPDDHHLWASLGCAAENLLTAAAAVGVRGETTVGENGIDIDLEPGPVAGGHLAAVIAQRQCTRRPYDAAPVGAADLAALEAAGTGDGTVVMLITDPARMAEVSDAVADGNAAQIGDPAWVEELVGWVRFNRRHAAQTGDGLAAACSGNPPIPRWIGPAVLRRVLTPRAQVAKDRATIAGSAGIAVFVSDGDDPRHWVEAGRCYERFALAATAAGIRNAFINQPVEVPELRRRFASWLGVAGRPDLVVRFGHGPLAPPSARRPLHEVLV